jgi:peptidoglycan/xylan/chitin deacetylase (PgdA/CDA1 family)
MVGLEPVRRSMIVGRPWKLVDFVMRHHPWGRICRRVRTERRVVALTYDDGPNPPHTLDLLDVLRRYGVKVTFFMKGRSIERHRETAEAVLADGHEIGNHTYSHPLMIFRTPRFVSREIAATDAILRDLGVTGDVHFRSPYGAHLFAVPYVLARTGRRNILFDVEPKDWKVHDPAVIAERVLSRCVPGSIVVLHDGGGPRGGTVAATGPIIEGLRSRGYELASVGALLAIAGLV